MAKNIKKIRWAAPYIEIKGREAANFELKHVPGVYLIRDKITHQLLYIGFSGSNLYKTMYRHFQSWNDRQQIRITYDRDRVQVRVVYCRSASVASKLEKGLIIKYEPKDNPQKYWINYEADQSEKKAVTEYERAIAEGVIFYAKDLPF